MRRQPLDYVFYCSGQGNEPTLEWLRTLNKDVRTAVGADMRTVQERWPISRPLVGSLGKGLYEIRTAHKGNQYRILFCVNHNRIVVLHGFQKKTQKTPQHELALAQIRYREFINEEK